MPAMSIKCYSVLCFLLIAVIITTVATENIRKEQIDVVFIVDVSARADDLLYKQELSLIPKIVSQLSYEHDKIRFGLITYSDQATLQMGLGYVKDNKALLHRLWKIEHSESTISRLSYALKLVRTYMFKESSGGKRFVIIFPNSMWSLPENTNAEVQLLQGSGVKLLMVMIDNYIDKESIMEIMDTTTLIYKPHITFNTIQKQYIYNFIVNNIYSDILPQHPITKETVKSTTTIPMHKTNSQTVVSNGTTVSSITETIKDQTTASTDGGSTVVGRTTEGEMSTFITPGHTSSNTFMSRTAIVTEEPSVVFQSPCNIGGELVFVIDATSAVSNSEFKKLLDACSELINVIQKSRVQIDIAIVTFGVKPIINLSYENYRKTANMSAFVKNIRQQQGTSGLGPALNLVREKIFNNTINYFCIRTILIFSASYHVSGQNPVIVSEVMRQLLAVHSVFVRIGNNTNKFLDDKISDKPAIAVRDFGDLKNFQTTIITALCTV